MILFSLDYYSIFIHYRAIILFFFVFGSKFEFNQNVSNYPTDKDKFVDSSTLMKSEYFPIFLLLLDLHLDGI